MYHVRRILVPVDFSPCSKVAAHYAGFLGSRFGATIDCAHVIDNGHALSAWSPSSECTPVQERIGVTTLERSDALEKLKQFIEELELELGREARELTIATRLEL